MFVSLNIDDAIREPSHDRRSQRVVDKLANYRFPHGRADIDREKFQSESPVIPQNSRDSMICFVESPTGFCPVERTSM